MSIYAGPAVENDLLSIKPVLLQPTLSSSPTEPIPTEAGEGSSVTNGPVAKKPRLEGGSTSDQQNMSTPPCALRLA